MPRTTPVSKVMSRDVRTAALDDSLSEVRRMVAQGKFHHVPIVDGGELVGLVSSRDLVQVYRHLSTSGDGPVDEEPSVSETMTTDLVTMKPDESVERAIDVLANGDIHSIPIVDSNDKLVGIVTNIDLLEYLFS